MRANLGLVLATLERLDKDTIFQLSISDASLLISRLVGTPK